jgi:hypothetical protein
VTQESLLGGDAAGCGEAAEAAVSPQDAVTGDNQRDRISRKRAAHGPGRAGIADPPCELAVSAHPAKADPATGCQNLLPERPQAIKVNGWISAEIHRLALKVGDDPLLDVGREPVIPPQAVAGKINPSQQLTPCRLPIRARQARPLDDSFFPG